MNKALNFCSPFSFPPKLHLLEHGWWLSLFLPDHPPSFSPSPVFLFLTFCISHSKPILDGYCLLNTSTILPSLPPETLAPSNINESFALSTPPISWCLEGPDPYLEVEQAGDGSSCEFLC